MQLTVASATQGLILCQIRGFRIELGEIDKWVSEHPLCQENVTLFRRDKDEEHTLTTYFIPNLTAWKEWLNARDLIDDDEDDASILGRLKRFRALRSDLRDFLRTKLPVYAIPSIFIPMERMPLNPNGKIDRPALPFPNALELSTAASGQMVNQDESSFSETEEAVAIIWAKVIPHLQLEVNGSSCSFGPLC